MRPGQVSIHKAKEEMSMLLSWWDAKVTNILCIPDLMHMCTTEVLQKHCSYWFYTERPASRTTSPVMSWNKQLTTLESSLELSGNLCEDNNQEMLKCDCDSYTLTS